MWNVNCEGRGRWAVTQKPQLIQHHVWHPFMLFCIELGFNLKNSILQSTLNSLPSASNLLTYFWSKESFHLQLFFSKLRFSKTSLRMCFKEVIERFLQKNTTSIFSGIRLNFCNNWYMHSSIITIGGLSLLASHADVIRGSSHVTNPC